MTTFQENRMIFLQHTLRKASDAYYNGEEIMSNREYDKYFDELVELEKITGVVMENSITQTAGAKVVDSLPKITHRFPALSLDKTKDKSVMRKAMEKGQGSNYANLMWKMDGSTIIGHYVDGNLESLATRGNGEVGSVITHNAPYIKGLPMKIPFKGDITVRGEAVMHYSEFKRINDALPVDEQYKNPRNLANATISLLDSREMREREIQFYGFNFTDAPWEELNEMFGNRFDIPNNFSDRLLALSELGFQVVENEQVAIEDIEEKIDDWTNRVGSLDIPVDGLVVAYDDVSYAEKQPGTGHNPNRLVGFAFKWQDELVQTRLRSIEWSVGRTGAITPVAIFDPVDICGTTVSRASLHNLSELKRILDTPYEGQEIDVYKANMIIPQVEYGVSIENLGYAHQEEARQKIIVHPSGCPCCNKATVVKKSQGNVEVLTCENEECPARQLGRFSHFVSRDCMNIVGMSEETISKFVNEGIIKSYVDFFRLDNHPEIASMEGFGKRSYEKMLEASEKARTTNFVSFVHSLGIPHIGKGQAKLLKNYIEENMETLCPTYDENNPTPYYSILCDMFDKNFDFTLIDGIGEVMNSSLYEFRDKYVGTLYKAPLSYEVEDLYAELGFTDKCVKKVKEAGAVSLEGKTFVVTGDVHHFKNRNELTAKIEELGGKCSGSVSAKTSYLINNDVNSTSGKNKKAKELNIPIISEEDFLEMISGGKEEQKGLHLDFNTLTSMKGIEIERALQPMDFYVVTWKNGDKSLCPGCEASVMAIETLSSLMPNGEYDKMPVFDIKSASKDDLKKMKDQFLYDYEHVSGYVRAFEKALGEDSENEISR